MSTAPTTPRKPTPAEERAAFEHWFSDQGKYPRAVERRDWGYKLQSADDAWRAWSARATWGADKT